MLGSVVTGALAVAALVAFVAVLFGEVWKISTWGKALVAVGFVFVIWAPFAFIWWLLFDGLP